MLAKIRPELDKSGIDSHGVDDVLHDLEKVSDKETPSQFLKFARHFFAHHFTMRRMP